MKLPVLFVHELESGIVSRTKGYEVKAHHLLVDVEDDVKAFIDHGWQFVTEGERAIEHFAELAGIELTDKSVDDTKVDEPAQTEVVAEPVADTPVVVDAPADAPADVPSSPVPDANVSPAKADTKAATSKGKSAAK
jgi:hypothetical protein